MSATRHPTSETLAAYAGGALRAGARLVVHVHLGACTACRREVAEFQQVGGDLLFREADAALAPDALQNTLTRLDAPAPPPARGFNLDRVLASGLWMPIGPDLAVKRLSRFADRGERLAALRVSPGQALPEHGHNGAERLVVIRGAFEDDLGRYAAGDLSERGPEDRHQPIACRDDICICLSATDGALRLSGIAHWLQPIMGL